MMKKYLVAIMIALAFVSAQAKIKVAPLFADNMILQREKPVAVFGKASPNVEVTVSFAGQTAKAKADVNGKWKVTLKPMKASFENREMTISDSQGDVVKIKNVLVGEVWLCSGQSNMECPMWGKGVRFRAKNGGLFSQLMNFENIRRYNVKYAFSVEPKDETSGNWQALTPDSDARARTSAIAMFFGVQLYQSLGVPIGLIDSRWGGTGIEAWTPAEALKSSPDVKYYADQLSGLKSSYTKQEEAELKKQRKFIALHRQVSVLYNAMINPLVPYTIRGVIWYQGCHNISGKPIYRQMMHALYDGWSQKFENDDLQFYFAQLAPFHYWKNSQPLLARMWEQQRAFAKEQPKAKMILTNDVGDLYDIHPNDKQTVGLRLAASALQHTYGFKIKADYPTIRKAKVVDDKVEMSFDNVQNFFARSEHRPDGDKVRFMEIAGEDGKFIPADVEIKGAKLIASAKGVAKPKAIRFLYAESSQCNVFNEYGLPLDAFNVELK